MLPNKLSPFNLLGNNYEKEQYSPQFNLMVDKVVNKIYYKKCRKRLFNTRIVNPTPG